jgi:transmembrane sensor
MEKNSAYYKSLIERYLNAECTLDEVEELFQFLQMGKSDSILLENMQRQFSSVLKEEINLPQDTSERLTLRLMNEIRYRSINDRKKFFLRFSVGAAVFIALISAGIYLTAIGSQKPKKETVKTDNTSKKYKNDILPGGDKAILTLADGSEIVLDDAEKGTLTRQGNTKIIKLKSGQLAYSQQSAVSRQQLTVQYNIIATPRGGQYQIILPDGSKVWLNAASSLRFATAFIGKERIVELTGEAYFEVESLTSPTGGEQKKLPFIVHINSPLGAGGMRIEVRGTHFNVMAYDDESALETTLLEGSVKIIKGSSTNFLKPGEQARVDKKTDEIKTIKGADVDEAVAWKNGLFQFNSADIQTIMRQVARWYDVEINYEEKIPLPEFTGKISRNTNASAVLDMLEYAGIHFKIDGKKIIVTP